MCIWLWYRRIALILMDHWDKLVYKYLINGLPKPKFQKDELCDVFQKGKQVNISVKAKMFFYFYTITIFAYRFILSF